MGPLEAEAQEADDESAQSAPAAARTGQFFLQGGVYGCCDGRGSGYILGAGAVSAPFAGLRLLGDGQAIGEPGYGAAFYGSSTVVYQFDSPIGVTDRAEPMLGAGMGVLGDGSSLTIGPQFVFGLGYKAAFGQIRIFQPGRYTTVVMLLGGVRF